MSDNKKEKTTKKKQKRKRADENEDKLFGNSLILTLTNLSPFVSCQRRIKKCVVKIGTE